VLWNKDSSARIQELKPEKCVDLLFTA